MNSQSLSTTEVWPIQKWTSAPLRLEKVAWFPVEPVVVFARLTEPDQMCRIFSWMHDITTDNTNAVQPNGLGAKRRCHFGNGMMLEEVIVGWEPPTRYAYRGVDETHPIGMLGHLGIIECQPRESGTILVWKHYFDHSNPAAMLQQLSASIQMGIDSMHESFQKT